VSRPIVLGPMTTVKTRAFVETNVWDVSRPNSSRSEGLLVVVFILLQRGFQLLSTIFKVPALDLESFVQLFESVWHA